MTEALPLDSFNALDAEAAAARVRSWLDCGWWVEQIVAGRPYDDLSAVEAAAVEFWRQTTPTQQLEAFAAHPLIGDVDALRAKFGARAQRAQAEQGQILGADDHTLEQLAAGNRAYREKHGFIFIICASGIAPSELLQQLQRRLPNDSVTERETAAAEQEQIMRLRLKQALTSSAGTSSA
ncbi:MAG: 2-oxo-4-hydroxy-4-carboxy-5-ureidoimidazoline decarboxylase [Pseudomonadota bacterium]